MRRGSGRSWGRILLNREARENPGEVVEDGQDPVEEGPR